VDELKDELEDGDEISGNEKMKDDVRDVNR
jgi:hypothetical protein